MISSVYKIKDKLHSYLMMVAGKIYAIVRKFLKPKSRIAEENSLFSCLYIDTFNAKRYPLTCL